MIRLVSFSYKTGFPKTGFVFDCRVLKNPHFEPALRSLDGRDAPVKTFVEKSKGYMDVYGPAKFHALTYDNPTIYFGCYGGRHRSVALAELLALELRLAGHEVDVKHTVLEEVEAA